MSIERDISVGGPKLFRVRAIFYRVINKGHKKDFPEPLVSEDADRELLCRNHGSECLGLAIGPSAILEIGRPCRVALPRGYSQLSRASNADITKVLDEIEPVEDANRRPLDEACCSR